MYVSFVLIRRSRHALTSHSDCEDVLERSCTYGGVQPEVMDFLGVRGVVPVAFTKEIPFDGRATHHGLFMTGTHYNAVQIGENLVHMVIDSERTIHNVELVSSSV